MAYNSDVSDHFFFVPLASAQAERISSDLQEGVGMPLATAGFTDVPQISSRFSRSALFFLFTGVGDEHEATQPSIGFLRSRKFEQLHTVLTSIARHRSRFILIGPSSALNTIVPQYTGGWCGRIDPARLRSELPTALNCIRANHVWFSSSDLRNVLLTPNTSGSVMETSTRPGLFTSHAAVPEKRPAEIDTTILTPRQREVAALVALGTRNPEIARRLNISLATVKTHVSAAMTALNAGNRTELALRLRDMSDPA